MRVEYSVLDPTGNTTILVTTPVAEASQPSVAAKLMELEPAAEQVGFLSEAEGYDIALRMAGGEFCGNASMCAAVHFARAESRAWALHLADGDECDGVQGSYGSVQHMADGDANSDVDRRQTEKARLNRIVKMRVSGAFAPVMARVRKTGDETWRGTVEMPRPRSVHKVVFPGAGMLPVVTFDGISHVICEGMLADGIEKVIASDRKELSPCEAVGPDADRRYAMSREEAEACAPKWCRHLGAEALGLMFLNETDSSMTPLVYVPAAGTLFWENSCASGTTACGAYLAEKSGGSCSVSLRQPGGSLFIEVRPDGGLSLSGTVRFLWHKSADITD